MDRVLWGRDKFFFINVGEKCKKSRKELLIPGWFVRLGVDWNFGLLSFAHDSLLLGWGICPAEKSL